MKLRAVILSALLLALPSAAATAVEALRGTARAARGQVSQLKADQLAQRNELSVLSSRIETLKAGSKGRVLPGTELDLSLKRSQELSTTLTSLARQVATSEAELHTATLALLEGLSAELTRMGAELERASSDPAARRKALLAMKALREERENLRTQLPAAMVPGLGAWQPSDDPTVLLEQADLLRDNEEKVRRELKAVETRLAERREEARLDRQMQQFMGEESMFDDQDRRLRVRREELVTPQVTAGAESTPSKAADPVQVAFQAGPDAVANLGGRSSSGPAGFQDANEAPSTSVQPPRPGEPTIRVSTGTDSRVQVGAGVGELMGDEGGLDELEQQRLKLKNLAEQLNAKARALETQAAQMK